MSKVALFLAVPALAGLAAWNVVLSNEISELRDARGAADARPAASTSQAPRGGEERAPRETARANPQMVEVLERLAKLEAQPAASSASSGNGTPGADAASGESADASADASIPEEYRSDAFRHALDQWYDARMEAQRLKRMTNQAEGTANFLLRDVPDVTDAQRRTIVDGLVQALRENDAIRQIEDITDEERRTRLTAVETMRRDAFASALSPSQFQFVEPKLAQRVRRGDAAGEAPAVRERVRERMQNPQGRKNEKSGDE